MNVEARLEGARSVSRRGVCTRRARATTRSRPTSSFGCGSSWTLLSQASAILSPIGGLLDQAEAGADWVMPGFTHLQTAQPVTWGHHMMAYVEMLGRDLPRAVQDARRRMNESPLGRGCFGGNVLSD